MFCLSNGLAQERILSYHTQITVEASGDLLVQEAITVKAEGQDIQRGIYRTFPTKYKDKLGTRFNVGFEVVEVLKMAIQNRFLPNQKVTEPSYILAIKTPYYHPENTHTP